ncbi:MAG: DegQ family serine endoprotease [Alphaproteobacteria bacterium]
MSELALLGRRLGAGLLAGSMLVWSAGAQAAPPPESFSGLVKQVSPAVVNIATTRTEVAAQTPQLPFKVPEGSPFEKFFEQFRGHQGPSKPRKMAAQGSGFVVDPTGYVVTNNHVIDGADEVKVRFADESDYLAKVIGVDPQTDLALLKIEAKQPLPFVKLGDSDRAEVGDWVVAVGNPFGLGGSVTAGIISARGRNINAGPYDDFLQVDASINRGNSGGPLFDTKGNVIGVNTAIFSPTGGNIGIGFAIPSNMVKTVVAQLRADGKVTRGWLGVRIQGVTDELAQALGLDKAHGAMVTEVTPDSPADKAGLRQGDVIVGFAGQAVDDTRDLVRLVGQTAAETSAKVDIWRDEKPVTLDVAIGEQPAALFAAAETAPESAVTSKALGAELAPLTPERRQQLGLGAEAKGVLVVDVDGADPRGLRPGDLIRRVGESEVTTPQAVEQAVAAARKDARQSVVMLVTRDGRDLFIGLKLPVA